MTEPMMDSPTTVTVKDGDQDSGVGSLNSGGQSVICIYVHKLDIKVTYLQ